MPQKRKTHNPHKTERPRHYDDGKYSYLYKKNRWRLIRERQLKKEPLCRMCRADGIIKEATVCDHIEPHKGDLVKFWNGPFQSLCKLCHDSKKQAMEKGGTAPRKIGNDGYPVGNR